MSDSEGGLGDDKAAEVLAPLLAAGARNLGSPETRR